MGDEKLDALITTAYNKITEMMFSPMGGTGGPDLASLTGSGGQPSMLDRATSYLRQNQQDARAENEKVRAENRQIREEKPPGRRARPPHGRRVAGGRQRGLGARGRAGGLRGGGSDSTAVDRPRGYRPRPPSLEPTYADQARPTDTPRTQPVAEREESRFPRSRCWRRSR